jgi:molybdate transport system substrate-binding protein
MKTRRPVLPVVLIAAAFPAGCSRSSPSTLTVSVAASLQDAMQELGPAFERSHEGTKVTFNFGGSGTLARQIEHGAPVDVFIAAASKQMDELAAKGLVRDDTRRDLLWNQVVLIAPSGDTRLNQFADLAKSEVKLIALGDPGSVPAGDYGRQVLESMQLWQAVQNKLVLAKDVRQVLTYVETGNADAGIVYVTDARKSAKIRIVATAPESSHGPIVYPVAVVKHSQHLSAARSFVSYLQEPQSLATFSRLGFLTVGP